MDKTGVADNTGFVLFYQRAHYFSDAFSVVDGGLRFVPRQLTLAGIACENVRDTKVITLE